MGLVAIGRVIKAFGLRGQILVEPLTDFPERFAPESIVLVQGRPHAIEKSREAKGRWILTLEGIHSLEEARRLRDECLTIKESNLRPLPPGQYYQFQILGLGVYTSAGQYLGEVSDILTTGSNDVYVVKGSGVEFLVPAIADFIREIDVEGGRMVVEMPMDSSA